MKRVLLADDSVAARKSIQTVLDAAGIEVVAVGNGDLALSRFAEVDPDVVLLDAIMPGRSGYEVCREIKALAEAKRVAVVLLTTEFEPYDDQAADAAGADGHILKPLDSAGISLLQKAWAKYANSPTDELEVPPQAAPLVPPRPQMPGPESFITGTMKAPILPDDIDTVPSGSGRRKPVSALRDAIAAQKAQSWGNPSPLPDHAIDDNVVAKDDSGGLPRAATTENLDIEVADAFDQAVEGGGNSVKSISIDDLHVASQRCPSCNAALVSGDIFCIACGVMVLVTTEEEDSVPKGVYCSGCGQEIIPGEIFCVSCGAVV